MGQLFSLNWFRRIWNRIFEHLIIKKEDIKKWQGPRTDAWAMPVFRRKKTRGIQKVQSREGQRAERRTKMFMEVKEEWSLQGFWWHILAYKWKRTRMNYFWNLFFQMFRTLKITQHPFIQDETKLKTMQKATGFGTSWWLLESNFSTMMMSEARQ